VDGSFAVFLDGVISYPDASLTTCETYMWRKSDKSIYNDKLKGKECDRERMHNTLIELYGIEALTNDNFATPDKLRSGQTQCTSFSVLGELKGGSRSIDMKDNPVGISDDGHFITFMAGYESATLRGTCEPKQKVSTRNFSLYDAQLGITWTIVNKGTQFVKRFGGIEGILRWKVDFVKMCGYKDHEENDNNSN